tara:strand:+ start:167 stop:427 length:261 start_codon:yes stop_codon:yes gene_type:complete
MPKEQYYNEGYRAGFRDGYASATPERDLQQYGIPKLSSSAIPKLKRKRPKTAYQKRYSTAYKKLKRKHPRMSFGSLSKKAHKEARK